MKIASDKVPNEKDDLLGRKKFASELGKELMAYSKKNSDGITISITGEWGSGKSTLLSYLKKELLVDQNKVNNTIIEFNPWIFYKEGNIKEAFLIHFALALKDFKTKTNSISKKVRDFISAFRFLKNINAIAGNAQEGLEKALDYFSKNDSITEIKEEIEKILLKSNKKIFVLIDDIDRLAQPEILQLMQLISLVMNFSNVYYILAFDKEIVVRSIEKEYDERGLDYLEKVIQIDYPLPIIKREKLESLFFQMLSKLSDEYKITFNNNTIRSLWNYHGLGEYFTTIRDFKRFFNSLLFRLPLIAEDINVNDFIAIEAIRIFDNEAYNNFYLIYSTNLRKRDIPEAIFKDEQLKDFRVPASDIIRAVFPKSSLHYMRTDTNLKRIYDSAYFERYFSLLIDENDISEKDFNGFMQSPDARDGILLDAINHDRIENLLKRLTDDSLYMHFQNYDYGLPKTLADFFNNKPTLFEKFSVEVSNSILNLLCCNKNKVDLIKKFFASFLRPALSVSVIHIYFFHYIRLFFKDNRGFPGRVEEFNQYFKDNFQKISDWYLPSFKQTAFSISVETYSLECPFIKLLYFINYAELFPEEYLKYQKHIFSDIHYILFLLSKFVELYEGLELRRYDFHYKDLLFPDNTFIEFYNIVKGLDKTEFNDKQKILIGYFLKIDISEYPKISIP